MSQTNSDPDESQLRRAVKSVPLRQSGIAPPAGGPDWRAGAEAIKHGESGSDRQEGKK